MCTSIDDDDDDCLCSINVFIRSFKQTISSDISSTCKGSSLVDPYILSCWYNGEYTFY